MLPSVGAASTNTNIVYPLYYAYSLCPFIKMDFSRNKPYDDSRKENVMAGFDAPGVQRSKRRTVLGVLSENELQARALDQVSQTGNLLLLCSVMSSTEFILSCSLSLSLSLLSVCRRANFRNSAQPWTDLTSNPAAVPPAPALTCTWRRPTRLSSQHLANLWAQITQTASPLLWKMMTRDSCWTWLQVRLAHASSYFTCFRWVFCSCSFLPRWFSAVWWILAIRGSAAWIWVYRGYSSAFETERSMEVFALCALLSALTVARYTFPIPDVVQAQAGLLGKPSGDHRWHAGRPRQLDGGSGLGMQAALRDAAPLCQLHGPLPLPDDQRETEQAAACWHGGVNDRRVSGRLHRGDTALFVNVPICNALCRKYEEINPPKLDKFVYTYSRNQLMRMEVLVLKTLSYRMTVPTINQFLSLYLAIQPACPLTQSLAMVSRSQ